jgi:hypothetical protein
MTREKRKDGPENDHHLLKLDPIPGTESCVISVSRASDTNDRAGNLGLTSTESEQAQHNCFP